MRYKLVSSSIQNVKLQRAYLENTSVPHRAHFSANCTCISYRLTDVKVIVEGKKENILVLVT
jgi:hypothetical protein